MGRYFLKKAKKPAEENIPRRAITAGQVVDLWFIAFRLNAEYHIIRALLTVLDESVSEARRLNFRDKRISVCPDGKSAKLNAVVFLRRGRFDGSSSGKTDFNLGAEGVHRLAKPREPVHHIAVVTGDTQLISLRVADNILFRHSVIVG